MRKALFGFTAIIVIGLCSWSLVVSSIYRDAIETVCVTVREKSFFEDPDFDFWLQECLALQDKVSSFQSKKKLVQALRGQLVKLGLISHLDVYAPRETKRLWTGQTKHTGLVGRQVSGRWVIFDVLPGSAAEAAGVKVGDVLLSIDGEEQAWKGGYAWSPGAYLFYRETGSYEVRIEPTELQIDESPVVKVLERGIGLLRITSFRKELFEQEAWSQFAEEELSGFESLVIDLRGNSGGSFVAMLRALSPFFCKPTVIGQVVKPKVLDQKTTQTVALPDNADNDFQVEFFSEQANVSLKTYSDYGCFDGAVAVLVDAGTASTAEIFTEALRESRSALVFGTVTAGEVSMGVWYDLSILGRGYSFSVPEAIYLNTAGQTLENSGVMPAQFPEYKWDEVTRGIDSQVRFAVCSLKTKNTKGLLINPRSRREEEAVLPSTATTTQRRDWVYEETFSDCHGQRN